MNIYLVERGEMSEGGSVLSAHTTIEGARVAAKKVTSHFEPWVEDGVDYWTSGCDWLSVGEIVLQD